MNTDTLAKAKKLLACIGEISDSFLDEAESTDIVSTQTTRKRVVQYGALAAAGLGIATGAYLILRSKRTVACAQSVLCAENTLVESV